MSTSNIRVILADDHAIVRSGLKAVAQELTAKWNGTPLPIIVPKGEITEEPHGWGSRVGFFKPLFSTASIPSATRESR